MKTHRFFSLLASLVLCAAATAQVHVQPVTGVHSISVEDNVSLRIYAGEKTQLESDRPVSVAKVANGVMSIEGNVTVVLRLNPADGIVSFSAEDGASIVFFAGSFDFGNQKITINTEDNARVEMDVTANSFAAGNVLFRSQDNSFIISKVPITMYGYNFNASDNAYIEVPSVDLRLFDDSIVDRNTYVTVTDNGKIVIKDKGTAGIISCEHGFSIGGSKTRKANRDFEFNWFWGFSNWGDSPMKGFGGINGDAEVSHYFMNVGFSIDYPLVNTSHFGLYAGLGVEGNRYHFTHPLVSATPTGFQISPASVTYTPNPLDPNNWDTYFHTMAMTVPITFSFEPWKYDDFCIRLTAIPGINVYSILKQTYDSKAVDVTVSDKECSNNLNPFMLDARLTLMYDDFGLYAQMAMLPLFKDGFQDIYPVKFGLFWTITGR